MMNIDPSLPEIDRTVSILVTQGMAKDDALSMVKLFVALCESQLARTDEKSEAILKQIQVIFDKYYH